MKRYGVLFAAVALLQCMTAPGAEPAFRASLLAGGVIDLESPSETPSATGRGESRIQVFRDDTEEEELVVADADPGSGTASRLEGPGIRMDLLPGDAGPDEAPILLRITNTGDAPARFAVQVLIDTPPKDDGNEVFHLVSPSGSREMTSEDLGPVDGPMLVRSFSPAIETSLGVRSTISGTDILWPSTFITASQYRLSGKAGPYRFVKGRDFSCLPFSVNDAAILAKYAETSIAPGKSLNLALCLFRGDVPVEVPEAVTAALEKLRAGTVRGTPRTTVAPPEGHRDSPSVSSDVAELNRLLKKIDDALSSGSMDMAELEALVEQAEALSGKGP